MKYIAIKTPGGPEVLEVSDGPRPEPGEGQVLIKVMAAGVNRPDLMQRAGRYPPPPGASVIPGLEVAGEVIEVRGDVAAPHTGDLVCALVTGGGYAEYTVAEAGLCLPLPRGLTPVQAAAIPETFFTVWSNVFDRGRLKAGESFLVHGGASGIGTTAIQLAREFHARVFATAGSAEKCRACEALGAEQAINYREQDFVDVLLNATAGLGIDVILDMVAGDYINRNIKLAAEDGRIVVIATLAGFNSEVNFLPVMIKRLTLTGSTLRPRPTAFKAAIAANLKQHVWPLLASGKIKPVIHQTFTLEDASAAHRLMEADLHTGKLVLTI
jgi:putative PIG3 family NAD(P)H quinone oxidoreductase